MLEQQFITYSLILLYGIIYYYYITPVKNDALLIGVLFSLASYKKQHEDFVIDKGFVF